ncbi:uncharacterized protein LOC135099955 [Scylla paramamosain]|uniref:uncharacterized protein LOC135099955 n=1 Tax=Scylla paramamosain TaxID=85552 RepID=UPI003083524E
MDRTCTLVMCGRHQSVVGKRREILDKLGLLCFPYPGRHSALSPAARPLPCCLLECTRGSQLLYQRDREMSCVRRDDHVFLHYFCATLCNVSPCATWCFLFQHRLFDVVSRWQRGVAWRGLAWRGG